MPAGICLVGSAAMGEIIEAPRSTSRFVRERRARSVPAVAVAVAEDQHAAVPLRARAVHDRDTSAQKPFVVVVEGSGVKAEPDPPAALPAYDGRLLWRGGTGDQDGSTVLRVERFHDPALAVTKWSVLLQHEPQVMDVVGDCLVVVHDDCDRGKAPGGSLRMSRSWESLKHSMRSAARLPPQIGGRGSPDGESQPEVGRTPRSHGPTSRDLPSFVAGPSREDLQELADWLAGL
jgi:hypothetical protein